MSPTGDRLGRLYDTHGDKLRFLIVGACNTALSYLLFLALLVTIGPPVQSLADSSAPLLAQVGHAYYLVVQWLGWVLMVPISTTTMKYFAFRSKGRLRHQIPRAYLIYLPAQGLNSLVLWLTVRIARMPPALGQLVAIGVVAVFSYLGHKYFTFRVPLSVGEVAEEDLMD